MTEDCIRRERREAPIPGADFPGLEEGTRSSFTKVPAKAVEVNELGEGGVHQCDLKIKQLIGDIVLPVKTSGPGTEYTVADTKGGQPCTAGNGMPQPKP